MANQEAAQARATAAVATGQPGQPWRRLTGLAAWLRGNLFLPATGLAGWRQVLGAVVFLAVGAAASLARTGGAGALNTIWIEDARNVLNDALNQSALTTVTTPFNGYFQSIPRVVGVIAALFPLKFAPAIMSTAAALQYAMYGLIAYTASGPFLRSRWSRLLLAAPACVIPLAYTQVNNDLVTVQFCALYGCFWIFLWMPRALAAKVGTCVLMAGITLTSILPMLWAPLVALRLIANRSRHTIALVACWAAGLAVQWYAQLSGATTQRTGRYTSPLWVLRQYVTRVVPRALFGEKALGGPGTNADGLPRPLVVPSVPVHDALIAGAWVMVAAVIIAGLTRFTAPQWTLAIAALASSLMIFLGEMVFNSPIVEPRYVIAPALLLYAGLVAILAPRAVADPGRARWRPVLAWCPAAVFTLVLAVAVGFNYRVENGRTSGGSWTATLTAAQRYCSTQAGRKFGERTTGTGAYHWQHIWWSVYIPCDRVDS